MRISNEQALQRIESALIGEVDTAMLTMEAEVENDEFGTLLYTGNLLGYALQANLEKQSIELITKFPEMCAGTAEFEGYCKVSGDTSNEEIPLAILAIKAESDKSFQAFIDACKLDLTLEAHQSSLIDESYYQSRTAGIVEMCAHCESRLERLRAWGAKDGVEIVVPPPKEPEREELGGWDDEDMDSDPMAAELPPSSINPAKPAKITGPRF